MSQECISDLNEVVFDQANEEKLAMAAKALGHPARVRLLKILASRKCLGSDLVGNLGLAQSTVSEHLRILKLAGFVHAEVQHPRTCYSLVPEAVEEFQARLNSLR